MILNESLKRLTNEELEKLIMIPVWITLLIAGADSVYSKAEIKRAVKIIGEKAKSGGALLGNYYELVRKKFEVNVKGYILMLPSRESLHNDFVISKIVGVNDLLKKLPKDHAIALYTSYRDLANQLAKASGGLFGLLSVSYSESKYLDLKMIDNPAESSS
jgi:hypothetical protein